MLTQTWREQLRLRAAVRQYAHHHDHSQHQPHRDAHQLALADEIRRRFASGNVTTGQIVMFGLSGGLIPCGRACPTLPYLSSILMIGRGLYVGWQGWITVPTLCSGIFGSS